MASPRLCFAWVFWGYVEPPKYMKVWHTYSPKQKILHNPQQRSLYRLHKLTANHTVRQCTCISKADPDISIRGIRPRRYLVSHTHTHSSWIPAAIPPNHPTSHPWSLQGSYIAVVDTVCNTSSSKYGLERQLLHQSVSKWTTHFVSGLCWRISSNVLALQLV